MKKDRAHFALAFGRLALAHHVELDDPTMEVYWESLRDIPMDRLIPALGHLTTHAAGFFPKPGEIRRQVDAMAVQTRTLLMPPRQGDGYFCALCDDTCWVPNGDAMKRCQCYPNNPVYTQARTWARRRYFDGEA